MNPGDEPPFVWALCQPCWDADHINCQGASTWCECMTEIAIEIEETP